MNNYYIYVNFMLKTVENVFPKVGMITILCILSSLF